MSKPYGICLGFALAGMLVVSIAPHTPNPEAVLSFASFLVFLGGLSCGVFMAGFAATKIEKPF